MKKKLPLIILSLCTLAALVCAAALYLTMPEKEEAPMKQTPSSSLPAPSAEEPPEETSSAPAEPEETFPGGNLTDWNLILLNPEEGNQIDAELGFETAEYDGQSIDARVAPFYEAMRDAAADAGITLFLRSGYRSIATQEYNYAAAIQRNRDAGMTEAEALTETSRYYTMPGHSEHHSGLALDIITPEYHNEVYTLDDRFGETDAYRWLVENCAQYGFILRYPADKEDITRITFEPWHYRYVGEDHAAYIMENGLCLEEYVELLREDGR